MKAIIENPLVNFSCEASIIFVEIVNVITGSENENHLRFAFKVLKSIYSDFQIILNMVLEILTCG